MLKLQVWAIDIGIRYVTGENDQIKFAISLKKCWSSFGI